MQPECWMCATTTGLRKVHNGWGNRVPPEFVCEDCFTTRDDGPCFDDLEPVVETVQADEVDMAALDVEPPEPEYTLHQLDRILADLAAMRGDDWMREQVAGALLRRHPSWALVIDHERKAG